MRRGSGAGEAHGGADAAEDEAVCLGGEAVNVLEEEGRAGDVGEKGGEEEELHEALAAKVGVPEKAAEGLKALRHIFDAGGLRQGLAGEARGDGPECAEHRQEDEDTAPRGEEENLSADDGRQDGGESVHQHEEGEKAGQLRAFVEVAGDRPRGDEAECAGEALQEAKGEKTIPPVKKDRRTGGSLFPSFYASYASSSRIMIRSIAVVRFVASSMVRRTPA